MEILYKMEAVEGGYKLSGGEQTLRTVFSFENALTAILDSLKGFKEDLGGDISITVAFQERAAIELAAEPNAVPEVTVYSRQGKDITEDVIVHQHHSL